jgi:thiamine pyrophosphokinase
MPAEESMNERIVIITGASPLLPEIVARIPADGIVLAADGGLDHALAAGLEPTGLIGDLDSISEAGLAWAARNATIDRHPSDKDATDTELALAFAAAMDPAHVTLIGGGDRLDHSLAAIGALGAASLTSIPTIDAWWGAQHLDILHGPGKVTLALVPGSTISLLALHGPCSKVSILGTRWQLDRIGLEPMIGHGISNEVLDDTPVEVSVGGGILTIFDEPAS